MTSQLRAAKRHLERRAAASHLSRARLVSCTFPQERYAKRVMNHAPSNSVSASETVLPLWETGTEEDAFFHAGGRIDALSVVDGSELDRRSDPTVQIRRYETRRSWLVTGLVALMAPLLMLAVVIGIGHAATRSSTEDRSARLHTVDDARNALSLATVTRAPLAMQQPSDLPAPRGRGPRSHRFGR